MTRTRKGDDEVSERAFFFGCWNRPGHFLFSPGGRHADCCEVESVDGVHLDGSYAPRDGRDGQITWAARGRTHDERRNITYDTGERPEGEFLLHERGGFTLIQWWDRSQGDKRGACNSTFLLEGGHGADEMATRLGEYFPHVVENMKRAGVTLRDARTHEAPVDWRARAKAAEGRVAALEAEAAETDKVLADTAAKWEEMERCAYNICAHCKEPFERGDAMSLHAQECPRNPVVTLNRALTEHVTALTAALGEALDGWGASYSVTSDAAAKSSKAIRRLRSLLSGDGR